MQTGIHAIGWGLQRFVIAVALAAFGVLLAYAVLTTIIVAGQAAAAFGQ
jgi:hypothetical protein